MSSTYLVGMQTNTAILPPIFPGLVVQCYHQSSVFQIHEYKAYDTRRKTQSNPFPQNARPAQPLSFLLNFIYRSRIRP